MSCVHAQARWRHRELAGRRSVQRVRVGEWDLNQVSLRLRARVREYASELAAPVIAVRARRGGVRGGAGWGWGGKGRGGKGPFLTFLLEMKRYIKSEWHDTAAGSAKLVA